MRRKLSELISLNAVKQLILVPLTVTKIKNWFPFLLNYVGFRNSRETYVIRDGTIVQANDGIDAVTIMVISVKKDYGDAKDASVVIDIGANIGVYSLFAASCSKDTVVYAYEPMPDNYDLLLQNIALNELEERIRPFKLGVCANRGRRKLFLAASSPFHSLYTHPADRYLEIDCISLKDILEQNKIGQCDILKMDCEGAEYEILYNTPAEYLRKIRKLRMEYHLIDGEGYVKVIDLVEFLRSKGFEITKLKPQARYSGILWADRK